MRRCGNCSACKRVEATKASCQRALAGADVRRANGDPTYSVGEDVRIVWNDMLAANPCEAPVEDRETPSPAGLIE
jgi:hypothetical protein